MKHHVRHPEKSDGVSHADTICCPKFSLFNIILSSVHRFMESKKIFRADRDFIHPRMVRFGFSTRYAVRLIYRVSVGMGLLQLQYMDEILGKRTAIADRYMGNCCPAWKASHFSPRAPEWTTTRPISPFFWMPLLSAGPEMTCTRTSNPTLQLPVPPLLLPADLLL